MKYSERSWIDATDHREPKWPLCGYAPGHYTGKCTTCEYEFFNLDKRATECLPCAIESAQSIMASLKDEVRRLEGENETLRGAFAILAGPKP